jgi:DNA-binding PadR family transcriptional regulator
MELTATGRVVLGLLGFRPMSGYEIKALVDNSTRFFWNASYGQIYPELRRLADGGLIEGSDEPQGGRKRVVYSITDSGRAALAQWHASSGAIQELRDETMLKLFLADAVGSEATVAALEGKRDHHRGIAAELREIQDLKKELDDNPESAMRTLRLGIDWNDWVAGWCERELESVRKTKGASPNKRRKR